MEPLPSPIEAPPPQPKEALLAQGSWLRWVSHPGNERKLLLLLTGIALAIRFHEAGKLSLWLDEASSLLVASQSSVSEFYAALKVHESSPPLYFLILKLWIWLFGESDLSIRSPSVIAGALAVPMGYKLAREVFDRRTAWLSAFLLVISGVQVRFSQEARPYSLLSLAAAWSCFHFIRLLKSDTPSHRARYWISSWVLASTHVYAAFVLLAQQLVFLSTPSRSRGSQAPSLLAWAKIQSLLFLISLPGAVIVLQRLKEFSGSGTVYASAVPSLDLNLGTTSVFLFGGGLSTVLSLSLILLAIRPSGNRRQWLCPGRTGEWLLLLWIAVSFLIPLGLTYYLTQPFFVARYGFVFTIPLTILMARGLFRIGSRSLGLTLTALLVGALLHYTVSYFRYEQKEDWKAVAERLKNEAGAEDVAILHAGYCIKALRHYLLSSSPPTVRTLADFGGTFDATSRSQLLSMVKKAPRVWLVISNTTQADVDQIAGALQAEFPNVGEALLGPGRPYFGVGLYRFSR